MKRTTATYVADVGKYVKSLDQPTTAAATYDPFTFQECKDGYQAHYDPADYIWKKNHFAACTLFWTSIDNYGCTNGTCNVIGSTRLDGELLMSTVRGARTIKYEVSIRGNSDPNFTWGTRDLTIPIGSLSVCYSYTTGHTCTSSGTLPSGSLASWVTGKTYTLNYTDAGTVGDPAYPAAENRAFFASYVGLSNKTQYSYTNFAGIRCDSASYVSGGGCVFDSLKGDLRYSLSNTTLSEVAKHIKDAQTNVSLTKPGYLGTIIPGGTSSGRPLTRNYYNTTLKNQSRTKVVANCKLYWGTNYTVGPQGQAMECDEYPFASTYQNAATTTTTTLLSYSSRPVLATHNSAAGGALSSWMLNDHILDGDPFWVSVVP